jgi:hypothetical protein
MALPSPGRDEHRIFIIGKRVKSGREKLRLSISGRNKLSQPGQPLSGVFDFGQAGVGVLPEGRISRDVQWAFLNLFLMRVYSYSKPIFFSIAWNLGSERILS